MWAKEKEEKYAREYHMKKNKLLKLLFLKLRQTGLLNALCEVICDAYEEGLKDAGHFISVKEQLPSSDAMEFLTILEDGCMVLNFYKEEFGWLTSYIDKNSPKVLYWAYTPTPPEEFNLEKRMLQLFKKIIRGEEL